MTVQGCRILPSFCILRRPVSQASQLCCHFIKDIITKANSACLFNKGLGESFLSEHLPSISLTDCQALFCTKIDRHAKILLTFFFLTFLAKNFKTWFTYHTIQRLFIYSWSCKITQSSVLEHFHPHPKKVCTFRNHFLSLSTPHLLCSKQPLSYFLFLPICLFSTYCINGIVPHVFFDDWFSLSTIFSKFIPVVFKSLILIFKNLVFRGT